MTDSYSEQVVPVEEIVAIPPAKKRPLWQWVVLGALLLIALSFVFDACNGGHDEVAEPEATIAETVTTEPEPIATEETTDSEEQTTDPAAERAQTEFRNWFNRFPLSELHVAAVDFRLVDGVMHVVFDPSAAGLTNAEFDSFRATWGDDFAAFAAGPLVTDEHRIDPELGAQINAVEAELPDGTSINRMTTDEIAAYWEAATQ